MDKIRDEIEPLVLAEFEVSPESTIERIRIGNINKTYFIYQGEKQYILQELNPIFNPAIHYDIVSVTEHLSAHGFLTPHIQKTRQNELWFTDSKGHVWRMYDYIVGHIHSRAPSPEICFEAGHLAGRFHTCLSRLEYQFQSNRLGVHDFNRHLSHLKSVIETHKRHDAYDDVASLANKIIAKSEELESHIDGDKHIAHGDLKLNNFVFSDEGKALCLIDLDTLGPMDLLFELGDAFRSWCNPQGENAEDSEFDLDCFETGICGYWKSAHSLWKKEDLLRVPMCVERISLELSARYCADALEESYFAWDRENYASAAEHNFQRALGQFHLSESVKGRRVAAEATIKALFVD
ncbi:MAG: phosphotransferase [Myxococcota bacterium]|jgi:Ser/Thr protein kinase RdoA (MazF antagonist)|nr:phosphotransferase [Myxococcota bacterium]